MEPITAALAAGAAAGLTAVASQAVKDAYGRLKEALAARFPQAQTHIQALEARPDSQAKQASLAEDLAETGADRDADLQQLAQALLDELAERGVVNAIRRRIRTSIHRSSPDRLHAVLREETGRDHALGALRRYSLLQGQGDGLRVHRLVQWVVRESLEAKAWERWLGAALRLLRAAFPEWVQDPEQWPLSARLLPHAQAVTGWVSDRTPEPMATVWLLDRSAAYLRARGEYALARPLFERALAINEQVLVPSPRHTAVSLNNLALLLKNERELDAARPLLERALAIRERVLGPDHPDTALSLHNLAYLLQDQGELAAARPLYERALARPSHRREGAGARPPRHRRLPQQPGPAAPGPGRAGRRPAPLRARPGHL